MPDKKKRTKKRREAAEEAAEEPPAPEARAPRGKKAYERKIFSDDERRNLLNGYAELPREQWEKLGAPVYIRVEKTDGRFMRGGQVVRVFQNDDEAAKRVELRAALTGRTFTFLFSDLAKVWAKGALPDKNPAEEIAELRQRVAKLEIDLNRLVRVVAKVRASQESY
jgi:hypothetical protein